WRNASGALPPHRSWGRQRTCGLPGIARNCRILEAVGRRWISGHSVDCGDRGCVGDTPYVVVVRWRRDPSSVVFCIAVGARAVVPYLAEQFAEAQEPGGMAQVRAAITAGMRKVLARMGVSTLASYRNSYLFEIVGLSEQFCSDFFEDAADFAGQKSLDDL